MDRIAVYMILKETAVLLIYYSGLVFPGKLKYLKSEQKCRVWQKKTGVYVSIETIHLLTNYQLLHMSDKSVDPLLIPLNLKCCWTFDLIRSIHPSMHIRSW